MDIDELQKTVDSMGQLLVTDEEFHEAASTVAAVTNLTDEQRLQMYGLFKTVTVGAVNTSRPWGVDFVGCAKW
jgi:acyl-CoA-binding protein